LDVFGITEYFVDADTALIAGLVAGFTAFFMRSPDAGDLVFCRAGRIAGFFALVAFANAAFECFLLKAMNVFHGSSVLDAETFGDTFELGGVWFGLLPALYTETTHQPLANHRSDSTGN